MKGGGGAGERDVKAKQQLQRAAKKKKEERKEITVAYLAWLLKEIFSPAVKILPDCDGAFTSQTQELKAAELRRLDDSHCELKISL